MRRDTDDARDGFLSWRETQRRERLKREQEYWRTLLEIALDIERSYAERRLEAYKLDQEAARRLREALLRR